VGAERDKILKELYSPLEDLASEEETHKLQEIAWGLANMEKAKPSSSFQDELRSCLLQEAPQLQADVWSDKFSGRWLKRFYRDLSGPASRFRSSFAFVAVALIIIVMAVFSHQPWNPPSRVADPQKPAYEQRTSQREGPAGSGEKTLPGEQPGLEEPGKDPAAEETGAGGHTPGKSGDSSPNSGEQPASGIGTSEGAGSQVGEAVPHGDENHGPGSGLNEPPIPEKPKFQIEGEIRDLHLAGAVILSPLYVGGTGEEKPSYNNVTATLRPNGKYAIATPESEAIFGSNAWADGLLKNQGFKVRSGDSLEVITQETLQGNFAEIFFQPGGKGSQHPILVLHCKEPGKILGSYYQEKGTFIETGYYPLLTPAQALKAQQLTVVSSSQPSLIFTEVRIEFGDFLLDDGKVQQDITLPAYCFTGRETATDSEIKICLPAVSR
jgi:hypothetical protein